MVTSDTQDIRQNEGIEGELPSLLATAWRAVIRGIPLTLICMAGFALLGLYAASQSEQKYEASAEIILLSKRLQDNQVSVNGNSRSVIKEPTSQDLISESHIIGSATLIEKTLERMNGLQPVKQALFGLRLDKSPAADAAALRLRAASLPEPPPAEDTSIVQQANLVTSTEVSAAASSTQADQESPDVFAVMEELDVMIEPGSTIIVVSMQDQSAEFALSFLEEHLKSYLDYRQELVSDDQQVEFLTERVDAIQRELADTNEQKLEALDAIGAIDPQAEMDLNWATIRDELESVSRLNSLAREARSTASNLKSEIAAWEATSEYGLSLGAATANTRRDSFQFLLNLHGEMESASAKYTANMEPVIESKQRFLEAKKRYVQSLKEEGASATSYLAGIETEVRQKQRQIGGNRTRNNDLVRLQSDLLALDARIGNLQSNYTAVLTSLETTKAASQSGAGLATVRILQEPTLTQAEPVSPERNLFIASGTALGLLLGLLLSIILFSRPSKPVKFVEAAESIEPAEA